MNNKDQIKEIAYLVNIGLKNYIHVHDHIFNEAATIKSFIKNLFGKGVLMSELKNEASKLEPLWDSILEKIDSFQKSNYQSLSSDEKKYYDILTKYSIAVNKTIHILIERQTLWEKGTKDLFNNPMTLKEYKEKNIEYQGSVDEYSRIGQQLNDVSCIIFLKQKNGSYFENNSLMKNDNDEHVNGSSEIM